MQKNECGKGPGIEELKELGQHALHAADTMIELAAINLSAVEETRHMLAKVQKEGRMPTKEEFDAMQTLLGGLEESSSSIEKTMRGVLEFGKGKIFTFEMVSVNELLIALREGIARLSQSTAIILQYELCPKLNERVCPVDRRQISECVLSMIENAIEGGAKRVAITTSIETTPKGQFVEISVANDGRAIPEADLKKIFRLSFTTKKKGNGVGLAKALRIVEAHEGHIDVRSTSELTAFRLYLPL